jgi:hypothetical protein
VIPLSGLLFIYEEDTYGKKKLSLQNMLIDRSGFFDATTLIHRKESRKTSLTL